MGGPFEIKGNIAPSEKGLVEAPLSGRQAVWTRVTVEQYPSSSDGNPGSSSIVLNEVQQFINNVIGILKTAINSKLPIPIL